MRPGRSDQKKAGSSQTLSEKVKEAHTAGKITDGKKTSLAGKRASSTEEQLLP